MMLYCSSQLLIQFLFYIYVSTVNSIKQNRFQFDNQPIINVRNLRKERTKDFNVGVASCLCDNDYKCLSNSILSHNSKLQICVMSSESEKITIQDVKISQDGVVKFHPIKDGSLQLVDRNSGIIDVLRNPITSDSKSSVAVVKTHMLSSFLENPYPSQIAVLGVVKLSAKDQELKLHDKRRINEEVVNEKDVNFAMLIDLESSPTSISERTSVYSKILFIDTCAISISIVSVLLIAVFYKRIKTLNLEAAKKDEGDNFARFDEKNQHVDVNRRLRRRSDTVQTDDALDNETEYHRGKIRRHSAIELGGHSKILVESEHKIEFITELELV